MKLPQRRECPICDGHAGRVAYPYSTFFGGEKFDFVRCQSCKSVYIDPLPDTATFRLIYTKSKYHDVNYSQPNYISYEKSLKLLRRFAPENASVLDYGVGLGSSLITFKREGFNPTGVEYDEDAARQAWKNSGCKTFSVDSFASESRGVYDVLHLKDVLICFPAPRTTLKMLLKYVKPGGLVIAQGGLLNNPSPVYWAAWAFGSAKRLLRPNSVGEFPPRLLFRVNERQHLLLFEGFEQRLELLHWEVIETGWPYENGSAVKRTIASMAMLVGGVRFMGMTFGNHFLGVFRTPN